MLQFVLIFIIIMFALYLWGAITCFFTVVTFKTAYSVEYKRSRDKRKAVNYGLKAFVGREPFSSLTREEIHNFSDALESLPNPEIMGKVMQRIDKTKTISLIKNREFLNKFRLEIQKINQSKAVK